MQPSTQGISPAQSDREWLADWALKRAAGIAVAFVARGRPSLAAVRGGIELAVHYGLPRPSVAAGIWDALRLAYRPDENRITEVEELCRLALKA